ncbi:MAG TPA: DHA2 family efflux MFS transporter permease subunit [Jatrophihabitantaceae bacterium]|nr:DHA2 family efflux MFS transporter permease subunit [Jatrophihabitantaceae bacterium]
MSTAARARERWVLALASVASLMVALDQLVVATALSTIQRDLHAGMATLEWTVNAYTLSLAVLLITGSGLGERFGRRRMFVLGLAIFVLASAACALAPNTAVLITARAVQGAGSALVMPLAFSLLSTAYPPERRGAALGIFTALTGLAVVGGPLVGGAITQSIAWQWIFWVNVPIGALAIPLTLARVPESRGPRVRADVAGLLLSGLGALGIVWALVRSDAAGWGSPEVVATLLGGVVLLAAFVRWELRVARPMLPMRLFANRAFAIGNAAALLMTAAIIGTVFFLAQYLQLSLGYSPLQAGLRFLPWTTTLFVVAPVAGRLSDRTGARALVAAGLLLQGAGLGWVALNIHDGRAYPASILALVIAGCGASMAMPAVQNVVLSSAPSAQLGALSGSYNMLRQFGGVFGVAVLSAVFAATGGFASPHDFADGAAPALGLASGLAALGGLLALGLPTARSAAAGADKRRATEVLAPEAAAVHAG